jgi:hypothetical protein
MGNKESSLASWRQGLPAPLPQVLEERPHVYIDGLPQPSALTAYSSSKSEEEARDSDEEFLERLGLDRRTGLPLASRPGGGGGGGGSGRRGGGAGAGGGGGGDGGSHLSLFTTASLGALGDACHEENSLGDAIEFLEHQGYLRQLDVAAHPVLYRAASRDEQAFVGGGAYGRDFAPEIPLIEVFADFALHMRDHGGERHFGCMSFSHKRHAAEVFANSERGQDMYKSTHRTDLLQLAPGKVRGRPPFFLDFSMPPTSALFADGVICKYAQKNAEVLVVGALPAGAVTLTERGGERGGAR